MTAVPINFSQAHTRGVYLITVNDVLAYGILTLHPIDKHMCAYLNVDKERWNRQDENFRMKWDITFEGISSTVVCVPQKIQSVIPIQLHDFWIGIDYNRKGIPQPTADEVTTRLGEIMEALTP